MQEDLPTPGEQSLKYERKVALPNLNKCFEIVHEEKSLLAGPTGIHNSYLLGGGAGCRVLRAFVCLLLFYLPDFLQYIHLYCILRGLKRKNKNVTTITVLKSSTS